MASDIWLRTILIVRKKTCCRHIGYSLRLTARVLLYAPSHRQDSTYHGLCYTSCGCRYNFQNNNNTYVVIVVLSRHSFPFGNPDVRSCSPDHSGRPGSVSVCWNRWRPLQWYKLHRLPAGVFGRPRDSRYGCFTNTNC